VDSTNDNPPDTRSDAVCPVTGLPIVRRPEWTDVELDTNHWASVEVIGGHIVHTIPRGFATDAGVAKVIELQREAIDKAIVPGSVNVLISNYGGFQGATPVARRFFADDVAKRPGLAAIIFFKVSPILKLSIKLARRFSRVHIPTEIVNDYPSAVRRALEILEEEGVQGLPILEPAARTARQPESGALELDGYQARYEIIDSHIIHGRATGFIGLREMERHLEFENMVLSSLDRSQGDPVMVVDIQDLEGITAAARRLYVASLRNRQRVNPMSLYVCYGVNPPLRNAINISRPFLPFRIRIARNHEAALDLARRDSAARVPGTVDRIRSLLFPGAKADRAAQPTQVDDLLRLLSNIDWEHDGPVETDWRHSPDHPLAPVVDVLELIKADVDELFRARRRSETALRQSEERYRTILDTIVDGYYEVDLEGRVKFCNDALLRIFGFSLSEVEDLEVASLMDAQNRARAIGVFKGVLDTREPAHAIDWEIARKDGRAILIETSISLITDGDDRPVGFRGIVRDVTERVQTAQEKANLEVQLQRSQRMEAIGTLAGGIAHNFNNLLMGIQGNVSLLAHGLGAGDPHAKRLKTIEALVEGGSKLTAQLLGYARSGRVDVQVIDLNRLVLDTSETFAVTRKEYRVHTDLAAETLAVEVDAAQIEQSLLNLLINAADAMPGGGDLSLTTRLVTHTEIRNPVDEMREGAYALLSVRDTGSGMDSATMERIFEPFFTTKGMTGGTGLGLASAYGIVKAHGGVIEVESEVGKGATFNLLLPVVVGRTVAGGLSAGPVVEGEGTILVIDDDEAVLEACSAMLSHLRYTPICAASGRAALDIFGRRSADIDLVVLDLILTDLGGGEVYDQLKAIDPSVRVLLASGYSLDGEAAGILDRGCDDFIQKPFTMEELSVKLENLLVR
jgi:PAS domain S-box-containing protein